MEPNTQPDAARWRSLRFALTTIFKNPTQLCKHPAERDDENSKIANSSEIELTYAGLGCSEHNQSDE